MNLIMSAFLGQWVFVRNHKNPCNIKTSLLRITVLEYDNGNKIHNFTKFLLREMIMN